MILQPSVNYTGPSPFAIQSIRIGDPLAKADSLLGRGLIVIGDQPNSGRIWHFPRLPKLCLAIYGGFDNSPSKWGLSYKIENIVVTNNDKLYYTHKHIPMLNLSSKHSFWTAKRLNESKGQLFAQFVAIGLEVHADQNQVAVRKSANKPFPNVVLTFSKTGQIMRVQFNSELTSANSLGSKAWNGSEHLGEVNS